MELETINKLYLELSQITTATTAREILLQKQLAEAQRDAARLRGALEKLENHDATKSITLAGGEQRDVTISEQKEPNNG